MSTLAPASRAGTLARIGHALSDPTRVGILLSLREKPAYPSELADELGVSRQVMSNQLACLRGCGLVDFEAQGRRSQYRIGNSHLAAALEELGKVALHPRAECCEEPECTC